MSLATSPSLELKRLELAHLVAQQVEPRVPVARLAFEIEHAIEQPDPHAMGDPHLADERIVPAEVIEQLALRGAARQRLEFVLAVDVDEDVAQLAQQLHRHRPDH